MQFINHLYIHRRYPCAGHSMYLCNACNAFLPHFSCKCNGHLHLAHKHWNHLLYQGCDTYILQNKQSHWYAHLITKFNFSFFFKFLATCWFQTCHKQGFYTKWWQMKKSHIIWQLQLQYPLIQLERRSLHINSPLKALKQDWTTLNELLLMKIFEK